jgi:organic radical activating enzyme
VRPINISAIQPYIPARLKFALKPYYRKIFPNRLHVVLLPTFRCNYRCSYCTVVTKFDFTTIYPKAAERSVSDWLAALDRLPPAVIYIAGGEPFVYAGLADLVNGLPGKHQVIGIVSNLSQPASVYRKITRKLHLNASFHREFTEHKEFAQKVKELSDQFHIHVNVVATRENLSFLSEISAEMSSDNITLHVDPVVDPEFCYSREEMDFLGKFIRNDRVPDQQLNFQDFAPKRCSAGRNYVFVVPNGDVYTCGGGLAYMTSPLYEKLIEGRKLPKFAMGNLFDPEFRLNSGDIICALPCKEACDRDSVRLTYVRQTGT